MICKPSLRVTHHIYFKIFINLSMEYLIPIWWPYVSKIVQKLRGPRFSHCSCHCKDFHWFSRIFQIIYIGFTSGLWAGHFIISMFSASRRCVTHFAVWWGSVLHENCFLFWRCSHGWDHVLLKEILIKHLHSLHFFCWRNHLSNMTLLPPEFTDFLAFPIGPK